MIIGSEGKGARREKRKGADEGKKKKGGKGWDGIYEFVRDEDDKLLLLLHRLRASSRT